MAGELQQRAGLRITALDRPRLPEWAEALFRDVKKRSIAEIGDGTRVDMARADEFALFEALIPRAPALDAADLHGALECCYRQLLTEMRARGLSPLRFWNYLPEIGRRRISSSCRGCWATSRLPTSTTGTCT